MAPKKKAATEKAAEAGETAGGGKGAGSADGARGENADASEVGGPETPTEPAGAIAPPASESVGSGPAGGGTAGREATNTVQTANAGGTGNAGETAKAGAAKRAGAPTDANAIPVPAKVLRTTPAQQTVKLERPDLPPDDCTNDAWEIVQKFIPWTQQALADSPVVRGSGPAGPLWEAAPLGVTTEDHGVSSYMSAWDGEQALKSLGLNHLYQAGGNVAWLSYSIFGPIPTTRLGWWQVCELRNSFFSKVQLCYSSLGNGKIRGEARIQFPCIVEAFIREIGELQGACGKGPHEIPVFAAHGLIWAWYAAAYNALKANDVEYLTALWQAGRSVTLMVRHEPDQEMLITRSVRASEALRGPAKHCADTFLTFSEKLVGSGIPPARENMERLKKLGMFYNGAPLNYSMLAVVDLVSKIDAQTRDIFRKIDHKFGRETYTAGYTKLGQVLRLAQKAAADMNIGLPEALKFYLSAALRQLCEAVFFFTGEGEGGRRAPFARAGPRHAPFPRPAP